MDLYTFTKEISNSFHASSVFQYPLKRSENLIFIPPKKIIRKPWDFPTISGGIQVRFSAVFKGFLMENLILCSVAFPHFCFFFCHFVEATSMFKLIKV